MATRTASHVIIRQFIHHFAINNRDQNPAHVDEWRDGLWAALQV
jgi:hypothetical protein